MSKTLSKGSSESLFWEVELPMLPTFETLSSAEKKCPSWGLYAEQLVSLRLLPLSNSHQQ